MNKKKDKEREKELAALKEAQDEHILLCIVALALLIAFVAFVAWNIPAMVEFLKEVAK